MGPVLGMELVTTHGSEVVTIVNVDGKSENPCFGETI